MLRRYWLKFASSNEPSPLNLGCGVTAYDEKDARAMFKDIVQPIFGPRDVVEVIEDIDVSTLDDGDVRSNMGNPANRGVWFPLL